MAVVCPASASGDAAVRSPPGAAETAALQVRRLPVAPATVLARGVGCGALPNRSILLQRTLRKRAGLTACSFFLVDGLACACYYPGTGSQGEDVSPGVSRLGNRRYVPPPLPAQVVRGTLNRSEPPIIVVLAVDWAFHEAGVSSLV